MAHHFTHRYINNFLGYGNHNSDIWFIGYEESSVGVNFPELLRKWFNNHCPNVTNVNNLHTNNQYLFSTPKGPPIQPTWGKLIRIYLSYLDRFWMVGSNGSAISTYQQRKLIRKVQGTSWGTSYGFCILLELYPLPNKKKSILDTTYKKLWSSRVGYKNNTRSARVAALSRYIQSHCNKKIIDYSGENIFGLQNQIPLATTPNNHQSITIKHGFDQKNNHYLSIPHPCSHGFTNYLAHVIGMFL